MKQQRISMEQYVEVTDWCRTNKYRIEGGVMVQLHAAQIAGSELGYVVPITTIQRCAKIAKIKWAKSPPPPIPVPLDHEAILILISSLCGLYVETVGSVPDELANLKTNFVKKGSDI